MSLNPTLVLLLSSFSIPSYIRDSFDEVIKTELPKLEEHNFGRKHLSHERSRLLKARIKKWHSETKTFDRVTKHDNLLDTFESFDLFQKARVKWDIKGDENSKFFHGLIKQKRRAQMIHGIMKEGVWIFDPSQIKEEFLDFFKEKFKDHDSNVDFPPFAKSFKLCALGHDSLETPVSLDEVKNAVWDCGSSKAPGPDGFSFAFVKKYWDDIKVDILEYVNIFLDTGSLPHGSNSSFFTLITKVSNPIFINDFRLISLIVVHYKIIAKILANQLSKVIDKIISHEQSAFIVDRQILDGLLTLSEIVECLFNLIAGLIRGVKFGSPEKSNVYGIGVLDVDVPSMASNYGCASGSFPFTYLGLPIGSNMSLTSSWQVLLDKFQLKLSSWKANLLSIGGLHTLIKVVLGSLGSLKAFNLALLQKWHWRLLSHKNALWVKVIKALHGQEGGFDNNGCIYNVSSTEINEVEDTCVWLLGTDGNFYVKDARRIIDLKILPSLAPSTVWDKNIPRKAISCPSCNGNVESSNHIFFECNIAKDIWMLVRKWCDISFPPFTSFEHWKG
ncbi:hypothetical protein Tco_0313396 [Tanacetum coccineum]